jgi:hypothetical protein
MTWLRKLLGLCEHQWDTRFWGTYTHGAVCMKCFKIKYFDFPSPQRMPDCIGVYGGGWKEDSDAVGDVK